MGDPYVVGVLAESALALLLLAAGLVALVRRGTPGPRWSMVWGGRPTRVEGAATVGLGVGTAIWAASPAQTVVAMPSGLGLGVVVVAGLVLVAAQLRRPDPPAEDAAPTDRAADRPADGRAG